MMLSIPPTLRIRRPSPTTIEYTVSTRPPPSLSYTLLQSFTTTLRVFALFSSFLLLLSLSHLRLDTLSTDWNAAPELGLDIIPYAFSYILTSRPGLCFQRLASILPLPITLALGAVLTIVSLNLLLSLASSLKSASSDESAGGRGVRPRAHSEVLLNLSALREVPRVSGWERRGLGG